ncbi:MAG: GIY-YIG nuclease family protein [Deltaproteobacteria bacterium]|nr:GIY-YIG nuclease family protein [Deltaproteobacteria bacterium]MCB9478118.1 GIY-YIG nuclease family protein [Deltaproteobacteria bacterium]MCB9487614.1 GIY-YIG nuclease family protein [Deltaproteobacteria bacterium]
MFVYRIRSVSYPTQTYIGSSRDVHQRLAEHNAGKSPHTSKFVPWKFDFYFWIDDKVKAAAFERYLKTGSGRAFAKRHF